MPSEMIRPLAFEPALPGIEGGGGTTAAPALAAERRLRPAGYGVLFGHGQFRRGRNHCECPMLMSPNRRCRRGVHAGRRLDHRGLRGPQSARGFRVQLRSGGYRGLRKHRRPLAIGWHRFRRGRDRSTGSVGSSQVGRRRRRCQRHGGLGRGLRPGHDIGQRHIMIQLDVGRSNDGLGAVVRLRRH